MSGRTDGAAESFWARCACGTNAYWTESPVNNKTVIDIRCPNPECSVLPTPEQIKTDPAVSGWGWLRDYYNRRAVTA